MFAHREKERDLSATLKSLASLRLAGKGGGRGHLLGGQVIAAAQVVQGAAALAPPHLRPLLPRAPHRQKLRQKAAVTYSASPLPGMTRARFQALCPPVCAPEVACSLPQDRTTEPHHAHA